MSDEWKIAQGLKRQNQDTSLRYDEANLDYAYKLERAKQIKKEEEMKQKWMSGKEKFSEENEEEKVESLKDYILYCRENNKKMEIKGSSISFEIDDNNPSDITFRREDKKHGSNIANIKNGEIIYSEIESIERRYAHYRAHNRLNVPVSITRSIYVINCDEINEYYNFEPQPLSVGISEDTINTMIESITEENPEYQKGNKGEIYRDGIKPEEPIKFKLHDQEELYQYLESDSDTKLGEYPSGFYVGRKDYEFNENAIGLHFVSDRNDYVKRVLNLQIFDDYSVYMKDAKDFEKRCKYIYSLVGKTYEALGEKDKFFVKEDDEPNLDSLSDEELDTFIETESNKQKENGQKIERLQKIKTAKELILLSKQQDKEIASLESQIKEKGIEFDE